MNTTCATATAFRFRAIGPDNGLQQADFWTWCPSIIRAPDGRYHMFASRWPKSVPFHPGWMLHSEVIRAESDQPEGPYQFVETVLPARGAQFWDGCATHNPTIRFHGGRYYLYYTGITHPFQPLPAGAALKMDDPRCIVARSNKRVGLAWANTLKGPWHRSDRPILETKANTFYSFLTSNPAPWIDRDGMSTLLFKARAYKGSMHGPMTIGVAYASSPEGPYRIDSGGPVFGSDPCGEVEDPFLWRDAEGFKMIAKDMTGSISGQAGAGIMAQASDLAVNWQLSNPAAAYLRQITMADGTTKLLGNMERPFLFIQNGEITHLCVAVSNGAGGFMDATQTKNLVLPLEAGRSLV